MKNTTKMIKITLVTSVLSILLVFASSWSEARVNAALARLNRQLTDLYNRSEHRDQGGYFRVPGEVVQGARTLQQAGITLYGNLQELAASRDMRPAILQEFVRAQPNGGVPWLPIGWLTGGLRHSESEYRAIVANMNQTLARQGTPLDNDKLLQAYVFSGSIAHSPNGQVINRVRRNADQLGTLDRSFWDIRLEIHQEPSLLTIRRVEEYIARQSRGSDYRNRAESILQQLRRIFGTHDVAEVLNGGGLRADYREALVAFQAALPAIQRASDAASLGGAVIARTIEALQKLGVSSEAQANLIRRSPDVHQVDHLRLINQSTFALASAVIEKIRRFGVDVSPRQLLTMIKSLVQVSGQTGFMTENSYTRVMSRLDQELGRNRASQSGIRATFSFVESNVGNGSRRVRGMFHSAIQAWGQVTDAADRFVDVTLRESALLPLTNLLGAGQLALGAGDGEPLLVDGNQLMVNYRMLNPGIAEGELAFVTEAEIQAGNVTWHRNKIYFLEKTPASLQPIAGILTCGEGSMISHVQLLASNHGLPNVSLDCEAREAFRALNGQNVMMLALPNGEVRIYRSESAPARVRRVYNEYHRIQQNVRVRLQRPSRLDIKHVIRLDQLRIFHSGSVAGGKACGQGELASLFPDRVPKGIVLPFGVYFDHVSSTGIYEDVQRTFSDPELAGSEPEAVAKRQAALARIRRRIETIEFKPELQADLLQFLNSEPFRGRGVFVRSDTNAEDLPGFVGAGLNGTMVNVVGTENILRAIKQVWSSPFTERSFAWRNDLIENPWDIFPSVIIQLGINSDKAGVMIVGSPVTADTDDVVYIAANEDLGTTVVNGEQMAEETIFRRSNNEIERVQRSYATTRKRLNPQGGVIRNVPVSGAYPIVTTQNATDLARIGNEIQQHLAQRHRRRGKWDMEWGIINEHVVLFQIRPFIGNRTARNLGALVGLQTRRERVRSPAIGMDDPGISISIR